MDLSTFLLSISSAAFMGLTQSDLELARHNIDLLELMKEKTKGNLTADENRLIDQLLFDTRMKFVEIQKTDKNNRK